MKDMDQLSEKFGEGVEKIRESMTDAQKRMRSTARELQDTGEEAIDDARLFVRKHPVQALGIAAAVGALFGIILTSKSRRD